ncbi:glycerol-3-phosphate acyltransferase [Ligilactobacillus salivarius]|nr:glycerol-3-phosphate acyltransferase [Ligilactobacillus salivarius]
MELLLFLIICGIYYFLTRYVGLDRKMGIYSSIAIFIALFILIVNFETLSHIYIFGILLGGLYLIIKRNSMMNSWAKKKYDYITPYDFSDRISEVINLDEERIPYNRVRHFSAESEILTEDEGVFAISYDAHPHDDEVAFIEYGILVTTKGILIKNRVKDKNSKGYKAEKVEIHYQDIFYVKLNKSNVIVILRRGEFLPIIIKGESEQRANLIVNILKQAIKSGWSLNCSKELDKLKKEQDNSIIEELSTLETERKKQVYEAEEEAKIDQKKVDIDKTSTKAVTLGMKDEMVTALKTNQINDRFGDGKGHGHAAEQASYVKDFWKGKNPVAMGGTHEKHGADRVTGIINKEFIQTKYYDNPSGSINAAFKGENGMATYVNDGKMMTIEVPKDQYTRCVKIMEQKIRDGKVPNETNPANAAKYVKKGALTYRQSRIATKSIFDRNSTIKENGKEIKVSFGEKLVYSAGLDFMTGAAQALPFALVNFVWVYANNVWQGTDNDEALNRAAKAMVKPILTSAVMYTVASQFASKKGVTEFVGKKVAKEVTKEAVASGVLKTLTVVTVVGPDVTKCLVGKISPQQLTKNLASTGAGMVIGGWLGSVVPVVGTVAGAAAGSIVAKKVMDKITPDDNIIMSRVLREEFIEIVLYAPLSNEEFEDIIDHTFRDEENYPKLLANMFSAGGRKGEKLEKSREFIDGVLTDIVIKKFTERELPEDQILEAVNKEKDKILVTA